MATKNKTPGKATTNNPNGRPQLHGERKKYTIRLPIDLMDDVTNATDNTTEFIIEAIKSALKNIKAA